MWRTRSGVGAKPKGSKISVQHLGAVILLMLVSLGGLPADAQAQIGTPLGGTSLGDEVMHLSVGEGRLFTNPVTLKRVLVVNPEVADVLVTGPREVLVSGEAPGTTTLMAWDANGVIRNIKVTVGVENAELERSLARLYPGTDIRVFPMGGAVALQGVVRSDLQREEITEIVRASGVEVVNRLEVAPPRQIMLRVRMAEVSRTTLQEIGLNFFVDNNVARLGPASGLVPGNLDPQDETIQGTLSDVINLYLFDPGLDLGVFIQALEANGVFRSLAEPNLMAVEGKEASFLAGGEFPVPVPQSGAESTIVIQWKEFGVKLDFTPYVVGGQSVGGTPERIRLQVAPEVSSLDFANGIELQGFRVPTVLSRRANTEIELRDGQTFAIAGLIDTETFNQVDKVPFLGDIPILGELFKSRSISEEQTELLVLVTPEIVDPMNEAIYSGRVRELEWREKRGMTEGIFDHEKKKQD